MKTEQDFWDAYERLSKDGKCDGAGGMEYERVRNEWRLAGSPENLEHFIVTRANWIPAQGAARFGQFGRASQN